MRRPHIRSYQEAADFLGGRNERPTGQRATTVIRLDPMAIAIRYHNTDVVTYHHPATDKVATIHTGGWSTRTTVARINEYAPLGCMASSAWGDVWLKTPDRMDAILLDKSNQFYTVRANQHASI